MSIESLLMEQARLSDLRRELKAEGCAESEKCTRRALDSINGDAIPHLLMGSSCIEAAYIECKGGLEKPAYYEEALSFEEVWEGSDPCLHCEKVRYLKRERMQAGQKLGGVRAAITRVGRRLAKEKTA